MIFYFSGTGNSEWVAQRLSSELEEPLCRITDEVLSAPVCDLSENERLGFVFPVYAWAPPREVLRFVSRLRLNRLPGYVYFICTCGDDTGKTADIFCREVNKRGWSCRAGFSVVMPNTYVCLPGFDVDTPAVAAGKKKEAERRIATVIPLILAEESKFDCYEGKFPRLKSYLLRLFFYRFLMSPHAFHSKGECISCGKCEKACPLHNIQMKNGLPVWGEHCSMCLSCYHHCPKHTISWGNQTRKKGQYLFRK